MKSLLGSQEFAKCNFCLGWYDVTHHTAGILANLHICGGCFDKCRKSRQFRVIKPKTLDVFEVQLRKCLLGEVEMPASSSLGQLLEIIDGYETEKQVECQEMKRFLNELINVESTVLNQLDPIRDLINKVYTSEVTRVERLWEKALEEVDSVAQQLNKYRKTTIAQLSGSPPSLPDETDFATLKKNINERLLRMDLGRLKELAQDSLQEFFKDGFKLANSQELLTATDKPPVLPLHEIVDQEAFTQRPHDPVNSPASEYFLTQGNRKQQYGLKNRRGPFCSGEKQNNCPYLTQRSVSPFQPLRSPRDSSKLRTLVSKGSRKDTQSVDSNTNSENEVREQKKSQIRELLKNKPSLPSYKPAKEKTQLQKQQLYAEVVMKETIYEALEKTFVSPSMIELIAYNTQFLEFQCYLEMLSWQSELEIVRFVKVNLTDDHLNILLPYLRKAQKLDSLVLTNNLLTDGCLDILVNFCSTERPIRCVYLGRNYIQLMKCRTKLNELRALNVNVFI